MLLLKMLIVVEVSKIFFKNLIIIVYVVLNISSLVKFTLERFGSTGYGRHYGTL